jgi:hypothetical protein
MLVLASLSAAIGGCIVIDGMGFDWFRMQPAWAYAGGAVCLAVLWWLWESGDPVTHVQRAVVLIPTGSSHVASSAVVSQPTIQTPAVREFTTRTVDELLGYFRDHNGLLADKLIEPFKGLWLNVEGSIIHLFPSGVDGTSCAQIRDHPGNFIECRFGAEWSHALSRYEKVDWLRVRGKIAQRQIGGQLYLVDCEPIQAPANAPSA